MGTDDVGLTIALVAINFVITWVSALSLPLVVRYIFVRRPLSRQASNLIALGWCGLCWLSFRMAANLSGQASFGVVWLLAFFVVRWLLNKGSDDASVRRRKYGVFGTNYDPAAQPQTNPQKDPKERETPMTRDRMISGLRAIIADPEVSDATRAKASQQLARLEGD